MLALGHTCSTNVPLVLLFFVMCCHCVVLLIMLPVCCEILSWGDGKWVASLSAGSSDILGSSSSTASVGDCSVAQYSSAQTLVMVICRCSTVQMVVPKPTQWKVLLSQASALRSPIFRSFFRNDLSFRHFFKGFVWFLWPCLETTLAKAIKQANVFFSGSVDGALRG